MKTFDELFVDKTRYCVKVQTSEYKESGSYIIIDQGQSKIAGYTDRETGLFKEVPVIIFGDHTRVIKYVDQPFYLGADGVKVLRSKDENANYKYLYYALKNVIIPDTGYNRHYKWLKEIQIEYPDSNKQAQIVNILDKVLDVISKRKEELKELDNLIKARFVEMFGDPVSNSYGLSEATLPKLGEFGRGVSKHRPRNDPRLLDGQYPLIQTGDIANAGLYITSYNSTYSELGLQQSKMWILEFDACFPDSVVGFVANERTNNIFIHYWFSFFQEMLESQAPESAQKNINLKILSELKVIVPEKEMQDEFSDFVRQIDKSKFIVIEGKNYEKHI